MLFEPQKSHRSSSLFDPQKVALLNELQDKLHQLNCTPYSGHLNQFLENVKIECNGLRKYKRERGAYMCSRCS